MNSTELDQTQASGPPAPPPGTRTMALVRWALVGLMTVVAAGAVLSHFLPSLVGPGGAGVQGKLYFCPMHPQIVEDHPGQCPICSMNLVPRPEGTVKPSATMEPSPAAAGLAGKAGTRAHGKFYCPMHPQVSSDDPGARCDLCGGMKLLPRPAQGAAPPAAESVPGLVPVDIPQDRVQAIGVRTEKVTRQTLVGDLRTVGVVEANERGMARISPRFGGWIEELFVAETGQRVRRGQALATIYSPEVLQAQQELLTALGWTGNPPAAAPPHHGDSSPLDGLVTDARRRLELLGISPQEIDSLVKNRRAQRAIALRSPVEGHVIAKAAVVGMTVSPGMPLFEVADLSTVWVIAEVHESDVPRVAVGQNARFQATASPGETFTGKVKFLHPTLDAGSRTLRARLEFRNRPGAAGLKLRPGMYGNVSLDLPATTGLMVPSEAVADTGDIQYVFVVKTGSRFEPRRVKLGARHDDRIQVVAGLSEGETVVTTANFLIDSESRLRAAIEGKALAPDGR
jgi:membrane fusion protein, copper/silver efflux system